jgi:hypothetical protein
VSNEEVDKIKARADAMKRAHPKLRFGQSLMNALFYENRFVFDKITGTDADCFHHDKRIPAFLEELARN